MQLSVIIVNYNVKHFLEQCLYAVEKASRGMAAEVIVVDNHSDDNSVCFLQKKFPSVRFIANTVNRGFAVACNQGLAIASGRYILFLNPDCIVPEDCFSTTIHFLEQNPEAGAAGIRMLDGGGRFLKESKRAFPSPLTSLFKLLGLARLFPRSRTFARYHLGYLDEHKNHEVDVLAGAFMMIKKNVLDITGSFDERFFMYGEDVDLSYRIQKAGYKNYYVADTQMLHFKGESTRKGSLNYVKLFYKAMSVFVQKHYGGSRAAIYRIFIHIAIWGRALFSALGRFLQHLGLPFADGILIFLSFNLIKAVWLQYVKEDLVYPGPLLMIAFPVFTIIYLLVAYYGGLYDKYYKPPALIRSAVIATLVLLAGYSLLPESLRFSRGIIVFGAMLSFLIISVLRSLLVQYGILQLADEKEHTPSTLVVATEAEYREMLFLLKQAGTAEKLLGRLAVQPNDKNAIAYWHNMEEIKATVPYREIIFCAGYLSYKEIIGFLPLPDKQASIKFHTAGSSSIIGSDSKNSSGEALNSYSAFHLADPYYRRIKRLSDVVLAVFFLLVFPVHFVLQRYPLRFFAHCIAVLHGKMTWVGYIVPESQLPYLRPGVIGNNGIRLPVSPLLATESLHTADNWYAKEYEPVTEIFMILRHYRQLCG